MKPYSLNVYFLVVLLKALVQYCSKEHDLLQFIIACGTTVNQFYIYLPCFVKLITLHTLKISSHYL